MEVPSWEYALPAITININKVNMRSFFMDISLSSEIDIKGRPALQVFRIINVHIVFNPD